MTYILARLPRLETAAHSGRQYTQPEVALCGSGQTWPSHPSLGAKLGRPQCPAAYRFEIACAALETVDVSLLEFHILPPGLS